MEVKAAPGTIDFDLAVVGGGPAGASAAITAARAGAKVLLLERGRLPRQRVCGEFVSAESLALLETLLSSSAHTLLRNSLRIADARFFLDGRTIAARVDPAAASISRFDLDSALWQAALDSGVEGHLQTTVDSLHGSGPFELCIGANTYRATSVINATGRWSNLTSVGATPHDASGARWLGIKAHFAEIAPSPSVDLYFFDGGYCGVQPVTVASDGPSPVASRINICAMVRADVASSLPAVFEQNAELAARSRHWTPLMEPVSTSPLVFRRPRSIDRGILLVGDAAGFVDPFVGDGISLALRSGAVAAQCLIPFLRRESSRAEAEFRYAEAYAQRLVPVFQNSSRLRRLLRLPRALRVPIATVLQHTPGFTSYLVSKTR